MIDKPIKFYLNQFSQLKHLFSIIQHNFLIVSIDEEQESKNYLPKDVTKGNFLLIFLPFTTLHRTIRNQIYDVKNQNLFIERTIFFLIFLYFYYWMSCFSSKTTFLSEEQKLSEIFQYISENNPRQLFRLQSLDKVIERLFKICVIIIKAQKFGIGQEQTRDRFLPLESVEETTELVKKKKQDVAIVIAIHESDFTALINSKELKEELGKKKHLILCLNPQSKVHEKTQVDVKYVKNWEQLMGQNLYYQEGVTSHDAPNFTFVTGHDKEEINIKVYNMWSMLKPLNRQKAREEFLRFAKPYSDVKERENVFKNYHQIKEKYPHSLDSQYVLALYTKQTFFYSFINRGLRTLLEFPQSIGYLRMPFSDLYNSVKTVYNQKQNHWDLRKKKMTVYRAMVFNEKEKQLFSENKDQYIQFEGFLSTSLWKAVVENFFHNTIIQIQIPEEEVQILADNRKMGEGFAFLSLQKGYQEEEKQFLQSSAELQVLFNPMNIFQVIQFKEEETSVLKLKYIVPPEGLSEEEKAEKIKKDPHYSELIKYLTFQKQQLSKIKNQGDVFYHNRYYEETIEYFDEYEKLEGQNLNDFQIYRKRGLSRLNMIGYDPQCEKDFKIYFSYCSGFDMASLWEEELREMFANLLQFYQKLKQKKEKEERSQWESKQVEEFLKKLRQVANISENNQQQRLQQINKRKIEISDTSGNIDQLLNLLIQESIIYQKLGQSLKAIQLMDESYDALENKKDKEKVTESYKRIIYRSLSLYQKYFNCFPEKWKNRILCLPNLQELQKKNLSLKTVNQEYSKISYLNLLLGQKFSTDGDYLVAHEIVLKSFQLIKNFDSIQEIRVATNLATSYFLQGEYKKTIQTVEKSIQSIKKFTPPPQCSYSTVIPVPEILEKSFLSIRTEIQTMVENIDFLDQQKKLLDKYHKIDGKCYYQFMPGIFLLVSQQFHSDQQKGFIELQLDNIAEERYDFIKSLWLRFIVSEYTGDLKIHFKIQCEMSLKILHYRLVDLSLFMIQLLFKIGSYQNAIEILTYCQYKLDKLNMTKSYKFAKILLYKAECYERLKNKEEGKKMYQQCLKVLRNLGDKSEIVEYQSLKELIQIIREKMYKQKEIQKEELSRKKFSLENEIKNLQKKHSQQIPQVKLTDPNFLSQILKGAQQIRSDEHEELQKNLQFQKVLKILKKLPGLLSSVPILQDPKIKAFLQDQIRQ